MWKSAVSDCRSVRSISAPRRHRIFDKRSGLAGGGARREEGAPRVDWPSSLTLGFPQTELEGFRPVEKGAGREAGKGGLGLRSQRQKERGRAEDSPRGRPTPGQMTSQARDPKAPVAGRERPPPPRAPPTQGPLFYLLVPAWSWERQGGRNVPAFAGCKAAQCHRLAEPSLPHPGKARAPRGPWLRARHPNGRTEFQLLTPRRGRRRTGRHGGKKGLRGTLKSDSEAISSSSSLVAEEAEIRVCCWLEVTRWGLLISPWLTVMAGLQARTCQREPQVQPHVPPVRPSPPQGDQHVSSDTGPTPPPPGKPTSSRSLLGEEAAVGQGDRAEVC